MSKIKSEQKEIVYEAIERCCWEAIKQPLNLTGKKTRASKILVAFFVIGGYDTDRDPDGSLAAFIEYCETSAQAFGRWSEACSDNWLGYLENADRMRKWQRRKDVTPEITGKKSKETYSC
jgi:hypothetical protein